jgi:hypothetical protein
MSDSGNPASAASDQTSQSPLIPAPESPADSTALHRKRGDHSLSCTCLICHRKRGKTARDAAIAEAQKKTNPALSTGSPSAPLSGSTSGSAQSSKSKSPSPAAHLPSDDARSGTKPKSMAHKVDGMRDEQASALKAREVAAAAEPAKPAQSNIVRDWWDRLTSGWATVLDAASQTAH